MPKLPRSAVHVNIEGWDDIDCPDYVTAVYIGDVNLEYGGDVLIYSRQSLHDGYFRTVRVIDLDSGCGFTGAVAIEAGVVHLGSRKDRRSAYECCGIDPTWSTLEQELQSWLYWRGTNDDCPLVLQLDPDQSTKYDGWTAERATYQKLCVLVTEQIQDQINYL